MEDGQLAYTALLAAHVDRLKAETARQLREQQQAEVSLEAFRGRCMTITGLNPATVDAQSLAAELHRMVAAALSPAQLAAYLGLDTAAAAATAATGGAAGNTAAAAGDDNAALQQLQRLQQLSPADALTLAFGSAVQQCRCLATTRQQPQPQQRGRGPGGLASSSSGSGSSYSVEARVAFRRPEFLQCLLPHGVEQQLQLPKHMAIDAIRCKLWHPQPWEAQYGDSDLCARLSCIQLGNLVSPRALPTAVISRITQSAASEVTGGVNLAGGFGILHQVPQGRVLSQWFSSPAPPPPGQGPANSAAPNSPALAAAGAARSGDGADAAAAGQAGPAPPRRTLQQAAADPSAVYVNFQKRLLQVVFRPAAWGYACGDGKRAAVHDLANTTSSGGHGMGRWLKLVIPFALLRGPIAVRVLDLQEVSHGHPDPAAVHPRMHRYQLVLNLCAPPEVYQMLAEQDTKAELQQVLRSMLQASKDQEDVDRQGPPMGGRPKDVQLSQWPPGSTRFNARSSWARAGDFTGAGLTGSCLTYVINIWEAPGAQDASQLLEKLEECGLAEPVLHWALLAPVLPCMPCLPDMQQQVLRSMALMQPPLQHEVGYALLCLTTSGLLPWELCSRELLELLAAAPAPVAEAALYSIHSTGKWLIDEPTKVIRSKLQALGALCDRLGGRLEAPLAGGMAASSAAEALASLGMAAGPVPGAVARSVAAVLAGTSASMDGHNCCVTKRVQVTPTRVVCRPPEMDLSNRVLREFHLFKDRFVRLCFSDEVGEQLFLTSLPAGTEAGTDEEQPRRLFGRGGKKKGCKEYVPPKIGEPWSMLMINRWRHFLSCGFNLLGRQHHLLAFSNNQLRSASAWFMAPVYRAELTSEQLAHHPYLADVGPSMDLQGHTFNTAGHADGVEAAVEEGEEEAGVEGLSESGQYDGQLQLQQLDEQQQQQQQQEGEQGQQLQGEEGGQQEVPVLDAAWVRYWLGSFDDCQKQPAKYAARLAQAFSATVRALKYIHLPQPDPPQASAHQQQQQQQQLQQQPHQGRPAHALALPRTGTAATTLTTASSCISPSTITEGSCAVDVLSEATSDLPAAPSLGPAGASASRLCMPSFPSGGVADGSDGGSAYSTCDSDGGSNCNSDGGSNNSAGRRGVGQGSRAASAEPPDSSGGGTALQLVQGMSVGAGVGEGDFAADDDDCAWVAEETGLPLGKTVFPAREAPSSQSQVFYQDWHWPQEEQPIPQAPPDPLEIPDVIIIDEEDPEGRVKYIISDGVGRMGMQVARSIMAELGYNVDQPLAIQVRFGGCKGMLVPWGAEVLPPYAIQVRKSMKKFESTHTDIEVVQVASFVPGYINRQIILLLLSLGLGQNNGAEVFLHKAQEMMQLVDGMLVDDTRCATALRAVGYVDRQTVSVVHQALAAGLTTKEPFVQRLLQHVRSHATNMLRTKTRIFLPASAFLLGVLDETGVLGPNEVFVQVHQPGDAQPFVVSKKWVLVTKNPCLNPGDIPIMRAVDRPQLRHLVNVVVFPQRGLTRPITDIISGSDLDGDQYFVCWDQQLIPLDDEDQPVMAEPAHYTSNPPAEVARVEMDPHIIDQYLYFQVNNNLGMIANAHVAVADLHPEGAFSQVCLQLASKHSDAVDFAKSCRPVVLPQNLKPQVVPHFMESATKQRVPSRTVLGRIYDWTLQLPSSEEVAAVASPPAHTAAAPPADALQEPAQPTQPVPWLVLQQEPAFEAELNTARELCYAYNCELLRLMAKYGADSEEEVLTGWLMRRSGEHARKREGLRQQILLEVGALRRKYQHIFMALPMPAGTPTSSAATAASGLAEGEGGIAGAGGLQADVYLQEAACDILAQGLVNGGRLAGKPAASMVACQQQQQQRSPAKEHALLVRASAWYHAAYNAEFHEYAAALECSQAAWARPAQVAASGAANGSSSANRGFVASTRGRGRGRSAGGRGAQHGQGHGPAASAPDGSAALQRGCRLLSFAWLQMTRLLDGVQPAGV